MKSLLLGASGAVLALAAVPAAAQTASQTTATTVQDIVVTAQRREQASQDVGASLSVVGGQELDEKNITVVNDLENVVPNLEVDSQFGGGQPQFRIRGVGAREYSSNNASTVGIYIDEVAHPYTVTTQGALFDIARIEVLRGPQGTLYGSNTTGGAVNIITHAPTADFRAGFTGEYGSYDRYKLDGYLSGQLAEGLLGRLAVVTEQGGAWQYNRDTGQKLGDLDKTAVRGRLTWDATDDVTVDLSATYMVDKSDGLGFRLLGDYTTAGGVTIPKDTAWRITGWSLSEQLAAVSGRSVGDKPGRDNDGLDLNAKVTANLGWADLTSISAYQTFTRSEYNDWDGTSARESDVYFYNDIEVLSQELRLASNTDGRWNWMTGLHYSNESNDGGFYTEYRGVAALIHTPYKQDVESIGVFTNNSFQATDRLNLILGLRYEYEERSLTSPGTYRLNATPGAEVTYSTDMSEVTGKLGLEYDLSENALFYANVARGVKSGGFTTYNATSATPFAPEELIAYETGVKSDFLNRSMRLNGAVFYYDYKNQQVQTVLYDRTAGRVGKIDNVPKSHIYGAELEFEWNPIAGLSISQNISYKHGEYDEYNSVDTTATVAANPTNGPWDVIIYTDRSGEKLPFPKMNYGGSIAYDWEMAGLDLRAETNYNFRDDLYSTSASSILPAYWLWNANFTTGPTNANWRVGLSVRNLFNTYYEETRNGFNGSARPTTSPQPGRTVAVRLSMDF